MQKSLKCIEGHLFTELGGNLWLIDTGAPQSFGHHSQLEIAGEVFSISLDYMGLNACTLSEFAGVECAGLIGLDVLKHFDLLFDVPEGCLTLSTQPLDYQGQKIPVDDFMGIPVVSLNIAGQDYRMFFDTGAQISYFQDASLEGFPAIGRMTDFYPGFGQFETETHQVQMTLGKEIISVRCGRLPKTLSDVMNLANTQGILGNEIFSDRGLGFSPRQQFLYF